MHEKMIKYERLQEWDATAPLYVKQRDAVIASFPSESAGLQSDTVYHGPCADNWQLTRCLPRQEPKSKQ